MKSIKHSCKAFISIFLFISFPATSTWARDSQLKSRTNLSAMAQRYPSRIIVEHAREQDIPALKEKYEIQTGKKVVPVVMSKKEAAQIALESHAHQSMGVQDKAQYAQRETQARHLQSYEGGDIVIAASLGTILLIAAVVLLIVLIVD